MLILAMLILAMLILAMLILAIGISPSRTASKVYHLTYMFVQLASKEKPLP